MVPTALYSIPEQASELLRSGILGNKCQKGLPEEVGHYASFVKFEGSHAPSLAINWRFAESVSALKGFEAVMINVLLKKKYDVEPKQVTINT